MHKLLRLLNKFRRPKAVFTRLPKGMRGVVRKVDPMADDIVYPEYTNLRGMDSNQASRSLARNVLKHMNYSPVHRMPRQRADRLLSSHAPMRRDEYFKIPMIRDINGKKVPDITARGAEYPALGLPSLELPHNFTQPATSKFIDYSTPLSSKGMIIPIQQKALHSRMRAAGALRPIDWANAEAGDPEYANKAYAAIKRYLEDPANGFKKYNTVSSNNIPEISPTYVNNTTGNRSQPQLLWSQMNRRHAYVQNMAHVPHTTYNQSYSVIPQYGKPATWSDGMYTFSHDNKAFDRNNKIFKYIQEDTPPYGLATQVDAHFMYKNKLRDANRAALANAQSVGHEINHLGTQDYILNGALTGEPTSSMLTNYYHNNPVELGQAAAHFKRQYFRNTGKLVDHHDKVEDAIAYSRKHIEDFDPESRRFLMSVDHLIDDMGIHRPETTRNNAYSRYEQLKRGIPLLFGGAVAAPMVMQGRDQQ